MALTAPSKSGLIAAKRSRELAETGYELMDKKRSVLIRELMTHLDAAKELQKNVDRCFSEAYAAMKLAEISMGGSAENGAEAVAIDRGISVRLHSVMGVELPRISADDPEPDGPPYGLAFTSSDLDDAFFKFRQVKRLLLELAETENTVYRLAYAIIKAQKRANALQNIVIPSLDADIAAVTDALEEKEREEFVRLKAVKTMKEERGNG